jgi:hypothetical protein
MTVNRTMLAAAIAILGAIGGWSAQAESAVEVTVRPAVTSAPGYVNIVARVEPDEENRALVIAADSGDFYRSSYVQLDGKDAARMYPLALTGIPAGEYKITVELLSSTGVRATGHGAVSVIGEQTDGGIGQP